MVVLVVVGGGVGAVLRWLLTSWIGVSRAGFPTGTTVVNVVGSFVLGFLVGVGSGAGADLEQSLGIGVLGGFTTFSTWMVELDRAGRGARFAVGFVPIAAGLTAAAVGIGVGSIFS